MKDTFWKGVKSWCKVDCGNGKTSLIVSRRLCSRVMDAFVNKDKGRAGILATSALRMLHVR